MPNRRRPRRNRRRRNMRVGTRINLERVVRVDFRAIPFRITQATTGTGGITSVESKLSNTSVTNSRFSPFAFGGRFNSIAAEFTKWRLLGFTARYIPSYTTVSGVSDIVAGTTTTPAYESRPFAWGFVTDASIAVSSYNSLIEAGGLPGNTSRPSQFSQRIHRTDVWYYTSSTGGSPSTIDIRTTCPGVFWWIYQTTSATNIASYGDVVIDFTAEFCGSVLDATTVG